MAVRANTKTKYSLISGGLINRVFFLSCHENRKGKGPMFVFGGGGVG